MWSALRTVASWDSLRISIREIGRRDAQGSLGHLWRRSIPPASLAPPALACSARSRTMSRLTFVT